MEGVRNVLKVSELNVNVKRTGTPGVFAWNI